MTKKETRLQKSRRILSDAKATEWRYVNTDNEFTFLDSKFIIAESVEEYKVYNKAGEVEDYTNEAYMEQVLVVLGSNNSLQFYNQNYDLIEDIYIAIIK